MGKAKVKIEKDLYDKVRKFAEMSGYTSADEFIAHCLENEISKIEKADSEEEIKKKLKGLGYIG
ncbi:MAG: ribbon-helix-helix domain-containing protein [Candidatus Aminicenantales bacterium]